jgi:4-amino-4-deoxy-L-arabinose transferase-like glycosyltransferase
MMPKKVVLCLLLLLFPLQLFRLGNDVLPVWVALFGVVSAVGLYYFTLYRPFPLLAGIAMIGYDYVIFWNAQSWTPPFAVEMVIGWVVAIVMLIMCCTTWQDIKGLFDFSTRENQYYYGAVLGVTLLGFALRVYRITEIPVLNGDEASITLFGMTYFDGTFSNPFISGWLELPSLMSYLPGLMVQFLGQSIWAMRLPALVFGVITIPLTVWMVRPMLDRKYAVLAGFVVATLGILINFSRLYYIMIFDLMCVLGIIGLILRSEKGFNDRAIVLIGVLSGIGLFGYASARNLAFLLIIWTVIQLIRLPAQRKSVIMHMVLFGVITAAVAGPLLLHYYQYPNNFRAPLQRASLFLPDSEDGSSVLTRQMAEQQKTAFEIISNNFKMSLNAIVYGPVDGWYRSNAAILPSLYAVLFAIGVIALLTRWRSPNSYIIIFNIFFVCLAASLSYPVAAGHRMVSMMGSVALLIAFGAQTIDRVRQRFFAQKTAQYITTVVLVSMIGVGAYQSIEYYFNTFLVVEDGAGDTAMQSCAQFGHFALKIPAGTKVDVYETDFLNRGASGVVPFLTKHLDYLAITEGIAPRSDAQVLVIPTARLEQVQIPEGYRIVEAKSTLDVPLLTFAIAPTLTIAP